MGLNFKKLKNSRDLFNLSSEITLPKSLTMYVNGKGEEVSVLDPWENNEERHFDDGFLNPCLSYSQKEFDGVGDFDIAMTLERTGTHNEGASRSFVVSQKFKKALSIFNIAGAEYQPVLVDN